MQAFICYKLARLTIPCVFKTHKLYSYIVKKIYNSNRIKGKVIAEKIVDTTVISDAQLTFPSYI